MAATKGHEGAETCLYPTICVVRLSSTAGSCGSEQRRQVERICRWTVGAVATAAVSGVSPSRPVDPAGPVARGFTEPSLSRSHAPESV
jgi:hypothetical protein